MRSSWASARRRRPSRRPAAPRAAQARPALVPASVLVQRVCRACLVGSLPACLHLQPAASLSPSPMSSARITSSQSSHPNLPMPAMLADVLLSPVFTGEALADAWLTEAQAGIAAAEWEAAEQALSSVSQGQQGASQGASSRAPKRVRLLRSPCAPSVDMCSLARRPHSAARWLAAHTLALPSPLDLISFSHKSIMALHLPACPAGAGGGRGGERRVVPPRGARAAADRLHLLPHGAGHAGRGAVPGSRKDAAAGAWVGR